MRILLLCESFGSLGGVGQLVEELAGGFARTNNRVAIVSNRSDRIPCPRRTPDGVEVVWVDLPRLKPFTWRHPERLLRRGRAADLLAFMKSWRPDIVNIHGGLRNRLPAVLDACRTAARPVVLSFHLAGAREAEPEPPLGLADACAVTFLTAAIKSGFERSNGSVPNGHVITGGVDCDAADRAVPLRRERPYIFSAARLDLRFKAIDLLIAAFARIANDRPSLDLIIAGDGVDRARLLAQAESLKLGDRVIMPGVLARDEFWSHHKGASLFAMPTRPTEGMGLVYLEAMACGVPVAATSSGGVPEVVRDGVNGVLAEPENIDEFAAAMARLIDDREPARAMGLAGREIAAAEYGWIAMARRYLDVYESCLR
jgi:glycogen(starch) synthase